MYFTFNKKNILLWVSLIGVILSYKCLNLPFVTRFTAEIKYASWLIPMLILLYLYKDIIKLRKEYPFIHFYLLYVLVSQIIICVYSMVTYDEGIIDMFICAGAYMLLAYIYILIIGMKELGSRAFLRVFYIFAILYMVLLLVNAILVNYLGIRILTVDLASKTSYMRAYAGSLYVVLMICVFWQILYGECFKKNIVIFILGIILELYVEQTRMYQLALITSFFFMWVLKKRNVSRKLFQMVVVVLFISLFFALGLHQEILNSFSIDPTVNENSSSSLARVYAIGYFYIYLKNNPLIGMGWVRPKNQYLQLIFSGPSGTAFFDDLGFLGQVFRQGILGGLIYLLLVCRLLYITIKINRDSKYKVLAGGVLVFIVTSAISINCFDGARILGTSFFIAIVEKAYNYENNKKINDSSCNKNE